MNQETKDEMCELEEKINSSYDEMRVNAELFNENIVYILNKIREKQKKLSFFQKRKLEINLKKNDFSLLSKIISNEEIARLARQNEVYAFSYVSNLCLNIEQISKLEKKLREEIEKEKKDNKLHVLATKWKTIKSKLKRSYKEIFNINLELKKLIAANIGPDDNFSKLLNMTERAVVVFQCSMTAENEVKRKKSFLYIVGQFAKKNAPGLATTAGTDNVIKLFSSTLQSAILGFFAGIGISYLEFCSFLNSILLGSLTGALSALIVFVSIFLISKLCLYISPEETAKRRLRDDSRTIGLYSATSSALHYSLNSKGGNFTQKQITNSRAM